MVGIGVAVTVAVSDELVEVVAVLVSELVEVGVGVTEGALIVVKLLEEVKLEPAFDPLTVNW